MKKRIDYLDVAKGIAIIFVMYGHCAFIQENDPVKKIIYGCHMALFFIISGMILSIKENKINVKKTLKNYLFYYYIFTILNQFSDIFKDIIQNDFSFSNTFIIFAQKLVFLKDTCGMWFLIALLLGELLFYLINKIKTQKKELMKYILAVFVFGCLFIDIQNPLLLIIKRALIAYLFIAIGNIIQNKKIINKINIYVSLILLIIYMVSTHINIQIDIATGITGNPLLFMISSLTGSIFILKISDVIVKKLNNSMVRTLKLFGKNSIIIFGTHMIFISFFRFFIDDFINNMILRNIVLTIIAIIIEYFIVIIYDKYKNRKEEKYENSNDWTQKSSI